MINNFVPQAYLGVIDYSIWILRERPESCKRQTQFKKRSLGSTTDPVVAAARCQGRGLIPGRETKLPQAPR